MAFHLSRITIVSAATWILCGLSAGQQRPEKAVAPSNRPNLRFSGPATTVAVVNLTSPSVDIAELARTVERSLAQKSAVSALPDGTVRRALMAPLAAAAEPVVDMTPVEEHLQKAQARLAEFDNPSSLAELAAAHNALLAHPPEPSLFFATLSTIHFRRGLAFFRQKEEALAQAAFLLASRLDKTRVLDPAKFPPEVLAAYQKAQQADPQKSNVGFSTHVDGANLWLDGTMHGQTPVSFAVAHGEHVVYLELADHRDLVAEINVSETQKNFEYAPIPASASDVIRAHRQALQQNLSALDKSHLNKMADTAGVSLLICLVSEKPVQFVVYERSAERLGDARNLNALDATLAELFPAPSKSVAPIEPPSKPWYKKPVWLWSLGASVAAVSTTAILLWATRDTEYAPRTGSFTGFGQ